MPASPPSETVVVTGVITLYGCEAHPRSAIVAPLVDDDFRGPAIVLAQPELESVAQDLVLELGVIGPGIVTLELCDVRPLFAGVLEGRLVRIRGNVERTLATNDVVQASGPWFATNVVHP